MRIRRLHPWRVTPKQAVAIQRRLAALVDQTAAPSASQMALVAGADISYDKERNRLFAAVVVLQADALELLEQQAITSKMSFPYVPGLLSFRETPPLLRCFAALKSRPEVLLVDGHGLAHPRRFGIACHLGLVLDLPTIGCAKTLLVGEHREPATRRGSWKPLIHKGEVVGSVLRTRDGVEPVFVSVGHKLNLETARRIVLQCAHGYRLPEPTRRAHLLVNQLRAATGAAPRSPVGDGLPPFFRVDCQTATPHNRARL